MFTVYLKYFVQFFYHPYVYILFSFLLFLCLSIFTNISIFLSTTLPLYLYTVPFCLAALLFIPPSNSLSLYLSASLSLLLLFSLNLSISLPFYLSISLPLHLSISLLSVTLSLFLSVSHPLLFIISGSPLLFLSFSLSQ